jgi:hypothetical protein
LAVHTSITKGKTLSFQGFARLVINVTSGKTSLNNYQPRPFFELFPTIFVPNHCSVIQINIACRAFLFIQSGDVKLSLHHFLLNDYQSFASPLILLLRGFRYSQIINLHRNHL